MVEETQIQEVAGQSKDFPTSQDTVSKPEEQKVHKLSDADTTYEDIFLELEKSNKDKEVLSAVKEKYKTQLTSAVGKKKIDVAKNSIIEDYTEALALKKAETIAENKLKEKIEAQESEFRSFLEQNNLAEITEEQLEEIKKYGLTKSPEHFNLIKTNPQVAKMMLQALDEAKKSNQKPIVQASPEINKEEKLKQLEERSTELLKKIQNKSATGSEKREYDEIIRYRIKLNSK